ncbi:MAG: hypothetical protein ABJE47_15170 [bacterium]
MTRCAAAVLVCCWLAGCSDPPVRPVVRAALAPGLTVEVIGLRRWSLPMISDSLAKYAPGESLASHACIANLRYKLGFADANIVGFDTVDIRETDTTRRGTMIVLVREPQDSARVHPVIRAIDNTPRYEEWRPVTHVFLADVPVFLDFYQAYLRQDSSAIPGGQSVRDSLDWAAMTQLLAHEHTNSGFTKAIHVLDQSPSNPDRSVAILILSRYPDREEAWRALLMAAVEDHQWLDSGIAQEALQVMSARHPRPVDWAPVAPVIRNVLDGTALPALIPVIDVLLRTGVDQRSAAGLLKGGGEVLTALLEVSSSEVAKPAHDLLVKLRGQDLGNAPGPWRKWIGTLR